MMKDSNKKKTESWMLAEEWSTRSKIEKKIRRSIREVGSRVRAYRHRADNKDTSVFFPHLKLYVATWRRNAALEINAKAETSTSDQPVSVADSTLSQNFFFLAASRQLANSFRTHPCVILLWLFNYFYQ